APRAISPIPLESHLQPVRARNSCQFDLIQTFGCEVEFLEFPSEIVVSLIDRVSLVENPQIFGADCAPPNEGVEIDYLIPILIAEQHHGHVLPRFARLNQRQNLEQLIHRAIAAGKDYERLREIDEPELAHEKVVKVEGELTRNIIVQLVLRRQLNIQ